MNTNINENELVPVSAGEVVKLQKPQEDTFTDIETNNDGVELGNCSVCGAENVIIADHICKTILKQESKSYDDLIDKKQELLNKLDNTKKSDKSYDELEKKIKMLTRSIDKIEKMKNEKMFTSISNFKLYLEAINVAYKNI
jgi:hypothetical protein